MIQVLVAYGPKADKDSPFKNNDDFIKAFEPESKQKQFAEMLLKGSIPTEGYKINVERVGLSSAGGLKALQYAAKVEMPGGYLSHETTMVAFHRDRIVKVTINYLY
ncbi:hypothetical protein [Candidatus Symbiopectobacterium sp.]|uniref:hypothetical protein n=1 Tax=Candidatus Symbiopectobacterium sp. TaxID=2816440 RepID=UPI0025BA9F4C|nr:hypothetical protein [Candidatus Symbiopectobacterium sp.]